MGQRSLADPILTSTQFQLAGITSDDISKAILLVETLSIVFTSVSLYFYFLVNFLLAFKVSSIFKIINI